MSLYQRINEQQGGGQGGQPGQPAQPGQPGAAGGPGGPGAPGAPGGPQNPATPAIPQAPRRDPAVADLRHRIHQQLIDELGPILFDRRLSEEDLRRRVHEQLHAAIAAERVPLSARAQRLTNSASQSFRFPVNRLPLGNRILRHLLDGRNRGLLQAGH